MPAHTITPLAPLATRSTMLTSANHSLKQRHTRCLPSVLYSENRDSSVKRTPLQVPTKVGYDDELQSGRDPDEDDEHADELP